MRCRRNQANLELKLKAKAGGQIEKERKKEVKSKIEKQKTESEVERKQIWNPHMKSFSFKTMINIVLTLHMLQSWTAASLPAAA